MIDRIETQQQDHQQYTERKQYKAIGIVSAIPATNRAYAGWVTSVMPISNPEPCGIVRGLLAGSEKCGYHVIHNEGKPTERHEWLLKEHFDIAYRLDESHGNDDMKCGVTGGVSASKCDAVTNDISESLKAQLNKIKDTGDKTQLKQEIDRAQAMISLAQLISALR